MDMKKTFQDGVDSIYNAIKEQGTTPGGKTPADLVNGIGVMATNPKLRIQLMWSRDIPTSNPLTVTSYNISTVVGGIYLLATYHWATLEGAAQLFAGSSGVYDVYIHVWIYRATSATHTLSFSNGWLIPILVRIL